MDKIKLTGKYLLAGKGQQATIELTPLELVEQISHKDMGEILKLINLPKEICDCEIQPCLIHGEQKPVLPEFELIEELKVGKYNAITPKANIDMRTAQIDIIYAINILICNQRKIINALKKEKV